MSYYHARPTRLVCPGWYKTVRPLNIRREGEHILELDLGRSRVMTLPQNIGFFCMCEDVGSIP